MESRCEVRVGEMVSESFGMVKRLRKGCVLSSHLLSTLGLAYLLISSLAPFRKTQAAALFAEVGLGDETTYLRVLAPGHTPPWALRTQSLGGFSTLVSWTLWYHVAGAR